jgi:hypothetical protein
MLGQNQGSEQICVFKNPRIGNPRGWSDEGVSAGSEARNALPAAAFQLYLISPPHQLGSRLLFFKNVSIFSIANPGFMRRYY